MITSLDSKASNTEFESLLKEITSHLETQAQSQPHYFPTRKGVLPSSKGMVFNRPLISFHPSIINC